MGNEQDGLALRRQRAHDAHQLDNLLRGEHRGGLIKNQDFVVAVEHLEDFHTLLHAHGDVLNEGIGLNQQAILLGQRHHLLARLLHAQHAVLGGFHPQHNVFQHREVMHQFEVLVHHADAQRVGIVGVPHLYWFAVLADLAFLRLVQAKQDAHQGAFPGAVFAKQGVNLPPAQLQGDVVIGADAGKIFGDVQHLNDIVAHNSIRFCVFHRKI